MAAMSAVRRRPNGLSPGLSMSLMAQIRSSYLSLALIVRSVQPKLGFDIEFATYPDPLPKISTMLRWMVATDGSSDSVNSCRASCHASNASRFFCQSG